MYRSYKNNRGFPGGPEVKNPPCNGGDPGSIPGLGAEIPHAGDQPSQCSTTTEPVSHNQSPRTAIKSLRATTKTQGSQINNKQILRKNKNDNSNYLGSIKK